MSDPQDARRADDEALESDAYAAPEPPTNVRSQPPATSWPPPPEAPAQASVQPVPVFAPPTYEPPSWFEASSYPAPRPAPPVFEPSAHTTEPSAYTTEPSAHTTEPSAYTTEPSAYTTEPSAYTTKPPTFTTEPASWDAQESPSYDPSEPPEFVARIFTGPEPPAAATPAPPAVAEPAIAESASVAPAHAAPVGGRPVLDPTAQFPTAAVDPYAESVHPGTLPVPYPPAPASYPPPAYIQPAYPRQVYPHQPMVMVGAAGTYSFDPVTGQVLSPKSKVVAGLLQLLPGFIFSLGGIGRLYAGHTTLGVIQIVASVVGWTMFWCGVLANVFVLFLPLLVYGAIWLWFVIDGIVMLAGRPVDGQGRLLRT